MIRGHKYPLISFTLNGRQLIRQVSILHILLHCLPSRGCPPPLPLYSGEARMSAGQKQVLPRYL